MRKAHRTALYLNLGAALMAALLCLVALGTRGKPPWSDAALFCWDASVLTDEGERETLFQTMEEQGLRVLYQAVSRSVQDEAARRFLQAAAARGIEVWLLTGDPAWGLDPAGAGMAEAVERAARCNQGQPPGARFRGLLMDCEPYVLDAWDRDAAAVMDSWVSAMKAGRRAADAQGLSFMACIPYYLDTEGFSERLRELVEEGCHGLAIMNYYKADEADHIQTEVALAREAGRPVTVVYELQAPGEHGLLEINTYHHDGLAAVEKSWEALTDGLGEDGLTLGLHEYRALREVAGYE